MSRLISLAVTATCLTVLTAIPASAASRGSVRLPTTPLSAVKRLVRCPLVEGCRTAKHRPSNPCYRLGKNYNPLWSKADGCPVTERLHKRLRRNPTSGRGGGADPICRCQMFPRSMSFRVVSHGMTRSIIRIVDTWSSTDKERFTFVVVRRSHAWLVDNIYCTNKAHSSIYDSPVKSC